MNRYVNISTSNDVVRKENNVLDYEVNENCDKYQVEVMHMRNIHSVELDILLKIRLAAVNMD